MRLCITPQISPHTAYTTEVSQRYRTRQEFTVVHRNLPGHHGQHKPLQRRLLPSNRNVPYSKSRAIASAHLLQHGDREGLAEPVFPLSDKHHWEILFSHLSST